MKLNNSLKFKLYLLQYPYRIRTFIENEKKGVQNEKGSINYSVIHYTTQWM